MGLSRLPSVLLFSVPLLVLAVRCSPLELERAEMCHAEIGSFKATPYSTFVDHFSSPTTGTAAFLHAQFRTLYPNETITVTYSFDPVRYAAEAKEDFTLHENKDISSLKRIVFRPAARRRDGEGSLGEDVVFAGYTIVWQGHKLEAIKAEFQEGFAFIQQWHLIGDEIVAKSLIQTSATFLNRVRDAILVFNGGFWQQDHALWQSVQEASWDDVILEQDFKSRIQHEYRTFFDSEEVYKKYHVPWKRGIIFLGPAGNGKTISLKAIMNNLEVPVLYVKSFFGEEYAIRAIFQRARAEAPCLLVFEDLDSLINDNNRSFFLNEVDGLEDNDGLLLIATTNHYERLDPALSNRPSRFDRKYTFPNPTESERRQYAQYWQNKLRDNEVIDFPDSLLDQVAERTDGFSFAYLKEAFVSTLLIIAGRSSTFEFSFRSVLFEQIDFLRKQIDDGVPLLAHIGGLPSQQKVFTSVESGRSAIVADETRVSELWNDGAFVD